MGTKKRIYELAKELEMSNQDLVNKAKALGLPVSNQMSALEVEEQMRLRRAIEQERRGSVEEKRVAGGIIRRRARKDGEPHAPHEAAHAEPGHAAPHVELAEPMPEPVAVSVPIVSEEEAMEHAALEQELLAAAESAPVEAAPVAAPVEPPPPVTPPPPTRHPAVIALPVPGQPIPQRTLPHGRRPGPGGGPVYPNQQPGQRPGFSGAPGTAQPRPGFPQPPTGQRPELSRRDLYEIKRDLMMGANRPAKKRKAGKATRKTEITTPKAIKRVIKISESITIAELAKNMSVKAGEVIMKLMSMGMMATVNQAVDVDTATLISHEFGFEVQKVAFEEETVLDVQEDADQDLEHRPPVVTIMGHVDHGKTSLLDRIRKTRVAEGEAGGITQHIGAYRVKTKHGDTVFLDTPGHEAFTQMRARGAQVTDLVVLVVAADDGVMPQTEEAVRHAKEAEVPIIVAVNKVDKPQAEPDRVRQELTKFELLPEEWGGTTIFRNVSAKTGAGVDELLEMIALQTEVLELKANPNKRAAGFVIEAKLEKGRGPVATLLVAEGTLKVGDYVVTGTHFGRVRALLDDLGRQVATATPSIPVEVLGLDGVPSAGDPFNVVVDEKHAKSIAEHRSQKARETALAKSARVSLADLDRMIAEGDLKELKVIVKADVQGSAEAVTEALNRLVTSQVKVRVIHSAVGGITESDVMLATASNAIIVGFNVRPDSKVAATAEQEKIEIRTYSIIYELIDEVKQAMAGLLAPIHKEQVLGRAEVRQTFTVPKLGVIAGCAVLTGKVTRSAQVRLIRDNVQVYAGRLGSLRRFKDDVREVVQGFECGLSIDGYNDIKPGDVIEAFEVQEVAPELTI